jgi:hypothetical protein
MHIVTVLILFFLSLHGASTYDFWGGSSSNNKNKVKIRNTDIPRSEYQSDTIQPNIAEDFDPSKINIADDLKNTSIKDKYFRYNIRGEKDPQLAKDIIQPSLASDLDKSKTQLATDLKDTPIKDKYLRYNIKGEKDPQLAKDLDPTKIKLAPDYIKYSNMSKRQKLQLEQKKKAKAQAQKKSSGNLLDKQDVTYTDETYVYKNNYVVFYDENDREESFIDIIPYITIGNSLFEISSGEYSARVLDDSVSASVTVDLGLNYIWDNRNIGYLWNINFGQYDFSEKDRTNLNAPSKGEISGYTVSLMPTVFYELNRAQTMSVLIGYGAGVSYINLDGSATLANSNDQTITNDILIESFYFSHGLLIEILHNNLMVSFTKVKIRVEEDNQNIKINENRLNIGYKFSF